MTVIVTTRDGDTVTYPTATNWDAGKDFLFVYDDDKSIIATHHGAAWSHAKVSTSNRDFLRAALAHWDAADFDAPDATTIKIGDETIEDGFLSMFKADGVFGQMATLLREVLNYADENNLSDAELDALVLGSLDG